MSFPGRQHFTHHNLLLGELSLSCEIPLGENFLKHVLGVIWTSPNAPFPFVDIAFYLFVSLNHVYEYNHMLGPLDPPSKSSNLKMLLGILDREIIYCDSKKHKKLETSMIQDIQYHYM